jgi:hypothetical protein
MTGDERRKGKDLLLSVPLLREAFQSRGLLVPRDHVSKGLLGDGNLTQHGRGGTEERTGTAQRGEGSEATARHRGEKGRADMNISMSTSGELDLDRGLLERESCHGSHGAEEVFVRVEEGRQVLEEHLKCHVFDHRIHALALLTQTRQDKAGQGTAQR